MKRILLLTMWLLPATVALWAIDFSFYQKELDKHIAEFKKEILSEEGFSTVLNSLNELEVKLEAENATAQEETKKETFLKDLQSVYALIGEISPVQKSFSLSLEKKKRGKELLGIQEEAYQGNFTLPVTKISLWNNGYACYMVENNTNGIAKFKFNYVEKGRFSESTGFTEKTLAHKQSSHAIFCSYKSLPVEITQVYCEIEPAKEESVVVAPVQKQPEQQVEQEITPLTKQQKDALKKKQAAAKKKEAAKKKAAAQKAKALKKKEAEKAKKSK